MDMGIQHNKIMSILNGVDKDVFKPMDKSYAKSLVEEIFKVRLRDKVLLHVNPGPRKGTHILIKVVAMVRKIYGDNFTLLIAGRLGPKTYREYVENMVKGLKLEENVRMLGYVENKLLPLLYNTADVTIVPSYSEGSPLVIPESLGCNTPVVATNVGGNLEYLTLAGLEELIVPLSNYDFSFEFTLKIIKALDNIRPFQFAVPSWLDISKIYFRVLKDLMDSLS
jgi:glycosyltransferase involved in cell wall biosynthesis